MISYKQLIEALNDAQKERVGIDKNPNPSPIAMKLSANMMPAGQNDVTFPLTHNNKTEVISHLEKHGFTNHDYKAGTTTDKRGKTVSIGAVLKDPKTQAPDHIVKGFENDNRSLNISPETHHVLLSRDPEKVAESSTNKAWKSCKTLTPRGRFTPYGGGAAARKIQPELAGGTHVAYLMKNGQTNVEKADARLMLHRYDSLDDNGNVKHSVLMPERSMYSRGGGKQSDFHNTVDEFARKMNPMKDGELYYKNKDAYDDDRQQVRFNTSPQSVSKILLGDRISHNNKRDAVKSVKLPNATISSVLNTHATEKNGLDSADVNNAHALIAEHQKLNSEHFNQLLPKHVESLAKNGSLTKSQVKQIANKKVTPATSDDTNLNDNVDNMNHQALARAHYSLTQSHGDKLGDAEIHSMLDAHNEYEAHLNKTGRTHSGLTVLDGLNPSKLKPEHVAKLKNSILEKSTRFTGESPDEFDSRIRLGINSEDSDKDIHKKLSDVLNKPTSVLHGGGGGVKLAQQAAIRHPKATPEHIDQVLTTHIPHWKDSSHSYGMVQSALNHKNLTQGNIDTATKSGLTGDNLAKHTGVARVLSKIPNLADSNVDSIMKSHLRDPEIVHNLVKHSTLAPYHIDDIIHNHASNPEIMSDLIQQKHFNHMHLNRIIQAGDKDLHSALLDNPKLSTEHVNKIVSNSTSKDIHDKALSHPNADISTLHELSNYPLVDKMDILNHPAMKGTPSPEQGQVLHNLVHHTNRNSNEVNDKILEHPAVKSDTITNLADHAVESNNHSLMLQIAKHPKASSNALQTIIDAPIGCKKNDFMYASYSRDKKDNMHAVASHPNASFPNLLDVSRYAKEHGDDKLHRKILAHPNMGSVTK